MLIRFYQLRYWRRSLKEIIDAATFKNRFDFGPTMQKIIPTPMMISMSEVAKRKYVHCWNGFIFSILKDKYNVFEFLVISYYLSWAAVRGAATRHLFGDFRVSVFLE